MMDQIKISMVGNSGSGKTMLLAGFNESLVMGCTVGKDNIHMTATGSKDDARFRGAEESGKTTGLTTAQIMEKYDAAKLMAVEKNNGDFTEAAPGTVLMEHFYFDVNLTSKDGDEYSQVIKITDLRGGLFDLKYNQLNETDISETQIYMEDLTTSEIIIIPIDGIKLAHYRDNDYLRRKTTGADRINALMNAVMKKPMKGVTVLVVVTKVDSDLIPIEFKEDNYSKLCTLACKTLESIWANAKNMHAKYDWNFSVIPCTAIGERNSITTFIPEFDEFSCAIRNKANIKQKNIDLAFIYSIKNALNSRVKKLDDDIAEYDENIKEAVSHIGLFSKKHREAFRANSHLRTTVMPRRNKYAKMSSVIMEGFSEKFVSAIRYFG